MWQMLSMVISVFEFRQGLEMPTTTAELYRIAAEAMLAAQGGGMAAQGGGMAAQGGEMAAQGGEMAAEEQLAATRVLPPAQLASALRRYWAALLPTTVHPLPPPVPPPGRCPGL